MAKILTYFFLLLVLAGCGFEGERLEQSPHSQPPPNIEKATPQISDFSCAGLSCDYGQQYCLLTANAKGKVSYKSCATVSTQGRSCDWAKRDAKEVQLNKASNCRYEVQCIESGEKIKVTCVMP